MHVWSPAVPLDGCWSSETHRLSLLGAAEVITESLNRSIASAVSVASETETDSLAFGVVLIVSCCSGIGLPLQSCAVAEAIATSGAATVSAIDTGAAVLDDGELAVAKLVTIDPRLITGGTGGVASAEAVAFGTASAAAVVTGCATDVAWSGVS